MTLLPFAEISPLHLVILAVPCGVILGVGALAVFLVMYLSNKDGSAAPPSPVLPAAMENPNPVNPPPSAPDASFKPWGMEPRAFCTLMHLSSFLLGPGFILFLVMWLTNKDQNRFVDQCGRTHLNWHISFLIYLLPCAPFAFFPMCCCIGLPITGALVLCNFAFSVIAALKANEGKVWKFPLAIPFCKVDTSVTG